MTEVFRVGRLLDVRNLTVLLDQALILMGDRVSAIEPWSAAREAEEFTDLSDYFVAPGLIDLHTHLIGALENGSYSPFVTKGPGWAVLQGVKNAAATLEAGFTTVRDMGTFRAFLDCDLRDAIADGIVPGPRMFTAGGYVTTSTGGGEVTDLVSDIPLPREFRIGVSDSVDEVRKAVRTLVHGGADFIKIIATGAGFAAGTEPGAPEYTEEQIAAAVEEAGYYGKHVAAHAHGTLGALRAVRAGVRTLDHGSYIEGDEIFDAILEHGTIYVPTTYLIHWLDDQGDESAFPAEVRRKVHQAVETSMEALRTAIRRGVPIAYGTDAIIFPHGENAAQMQDFLDAGMSMLEVIASATINAADALGTQEVGALEPGRYGDFVAMRISDPVPTVADLCAIDLVVKGGVVVHRRDSETS